jgi:hypothetical protein
MNRLSYEKLLNKITTYKNCGALYQWETDRRELTEIPNSGSKWSFQMNLLGFELGTQCDIRVSKLPRKKKKKLRALLKRRVRNCRKEINKMEFENFTTLS